MAKKENLSIDAEAFIKEAVSGIKEIVLRAGFKKTITGVSGGVDSAVALALAVKALGRDNVLVVKLPYGSLDKEGLERADNFIKELDLPEKNVFLRDIKPASAVFEEEGMERVRRGNIMARTRMIILYDLAKKYKALVCGTSNKSERLLGYFTRFGDEASDLQPIVSLYKTEVYQIAETLGVPESIIKACPSAGLWKGQTDEKELGFSYEEADPVLFLLYDKELSKEEVINRGFDKKLVGKIARQVGKNKFKQKAPYTLHR